MEPYVEDNSLVDVDSVEFCPLSKGNTEVDPARSSEMHLIS